MDTTPTTKPSYARQRTREGSGRLGGWLRIISTGLVLVFQILLMYLFIDWLRNFAVIFYGGLVVAGAVTAMIVQTLDDNPSYKMAWMFIVLVLPVLGVLLYWLWGSRRLSSTHEVMLRSQEYDISDHLHAQAANDDLFLTSPEYHTLSRYLTYTAQAPLFENTVAKYFPSGEAKFAALLEDLRGAKDFIFMEYFIVGVGQIWDSIHEVLRQKAAEGLDVRLMYDDFGSLLTLKKGFRAELQAEGIRVVRFNPVHKYPTRMILNYRDHRKIVIIDGDIGYTGGINLSDEYANLEVVHGHWKDTAIRLHGDAVWGLTLLFFELWHVATGEVSPADLDRYRPQTSIPAKGFFQPFGDGPANNPMNPASGAYKRMIYSAKSRITITSPYLILDNEMIDALCQAAESGVTVRVITPHIGDHAYVHTTSRSFYGRLLRCGVKIYEYTPGFMHAKMVLVDDRAAIVGTINMDFRSFYLHFECGVWMYDTPVIADIAQDIEQTLARSQEITYEQWLCRPWYIKAVQVVLNLFAPMM